MFAQADAPPPHVHPLCERQRSELHLTRPLCSPPDAPAAGAVKSGDYGRFEQKQ